MTHCSSRHRTHCQTLFGNAFQDASRLNKANLVFHQIGLFLFLRSRLLCGQYAHRLAFLNRALERKLMLDRKWFTKYRVMLLVLSLILSVPVLAGPLMDAVKSKIYSALSNDEDRWIFTKFLGDVRVDDAKEDGNYLIVEGSFKYEDAFGFKNRRYYTGKLKVVLDDLSIISLCWPYEQGTWCVK